MSIVFGLGVDCHDRHGWRRHSNITIPPFPPKNRKIPQVELDRGRTANFALLEHAIVSDLLRPDSPIARRIQIQINPLLQRVGWLLVAILFYHSINWASASPSGCRSERPSRLDTDGDSDQCLRPVSP